VRQLREEREILKKAATFFARGDRSDDIAMTFRLIEAEKDHHAVSLLARVLGVSRQGFYAWKHCGPSRRAVQDQALTERIEQIHRQSRHTYGVPRIHAELRDDFGMRVGRKRVARLMRTAGLEGVRADPT
jgi:putative transposase